MIVYLDASALVKVYAREVGSPETIVLITNAQAIGTARVTRAEVSAALSKAIRTKALARDEAARALKLFRNQWPDLLHVDISETLVASADALAWEHSLRGYDAVHLAAALDWQLMIDAPVTVATFDKRLWDAARAAGLGIWPETL
jgi:predicted nucleic acid-binding protein